MHDQIAVWHDDDIYLPHRLTFSLSRFDPRKGFFKGDRAWFWNHGEVTGPEHNSFHGGACYSRELFSMARGYPPIGMACDRGFESRCLTTRPGAAYGQRLRPEEVYYLYRWEGTGSYHTSALAQGGNEHQRAAEWVEEQAARGEIPSGDIALEPHWNTDYAARVRELIASGRVKKSADDDLDDIPFPPPLHRIAPPRPLDEQSTKRLFTHEQPIRISVVLPSCNESVMLERTVDQFAATLPAPSEIIVVDNGSRDGSADFLLERPRDGVRLIRTPDRLGGARARNRGLAEAKGEIVVFADAHVDVPERWWQPVVAALQASQVGVVGCAIGVMGRPEHSPGYGQRIAESNLRTEWLSRRQLDPHPVPALGGALMGMRRDTLERAGGFDPGLAEWGSEDLELCIRYWLLGYEVWLVPELTVLHYFRSRSPYPVDISGVTHNVLRVALLHFNEQRIARVTDALKERPDFASAFAVAATSSVFRERASLHSRRVRDDDWLFNRFPDCVV
jgi:GT2 family glycosyltransferase